MSLKRSSIGRTHRTLGIISPVYGGSLDGWTHPHLGTVHLTSEVSYESVWVVLRRGSAPRSCRSGRSRRTSCSPAVADGLVRPAACPTRPSNCSPRWSKAGGKLKCFAFAPDGEWIFLIGDHGYGTSNLNLPTCKKLS